MNMTESEIRLPATYLFLDIDGVLCTKETIEQLGKNSRASKLECECVERMNVIVKQTECQIVISSSWRFNHTPLEIGLIMANCGFKYPQFVVGSTPLRSHKANPDPYEERSLQIAEWMAERGIQREQVVILDDDTEMGKLQDRLVNVYHGFYNGGLLDKHVEQVVELLGQT